MKWNKVNGLVESSGRPVAMSTERTSASIESVKKNKQTKTKQELGKHSNDETNQMAKQADALSK